MKVEKLRIEKNSKKIIFPGNFNSLTDGICFSAIVDGHEIHCKITRESLMDDLGAKPSTLDEVFTANRQLIENIIKYLLTSGKLSSEKRLIITSGDIPKYKVA